MNIGLIGRARAGKDTVGAWLTENRGYERVAFADPLKAAALKLNPITEVDATGEYYRLASDVSEFGWERTKDETPEVRRILQELGASIRTIDPEFWPAPAWPASKRSTARPGDPPSSPMSATPTRQTASSAPASS